MCLHSDISSVLEFNKLSVFLSYKDSLIMILLIMILPDYDLALMIFQYILYIYCFGACRSLIFYSLQDIFLCLESVGLLSFVNARELKPGTVQR